MIPPLSPGDAATEALSVPGATLSAPIFVPALNALSVVDRGQQLIQSGATVVALPGTEVVAHALLAGSAIATSGGPSASLACVLADKNTLAPLPLEGAAQLSSVSFVQQLSAARVLAGTSGGEVMLLSPESAPVPLLSWTGARITAACVSADEKTLYLCSGGGVYVSTLDLDKGLCSMPELMASLGTDKGVVDIAVDVSGNVFTAGSEGVLVLDETGDVLLEVGTAEPVTGCCFSGSSASELVFTVGPTAWNLKTNTQGVRPATEEFLSYINKLAAQGEYRHVGW